LGRPGGGPQYIITDLGSLGFHAETREMMVVKLHPGVDFETIQEHTGFRLLQAERVTETEPPNEQQLELLRTEIDPLGVYRKTK
jgi:glutaconate CoA-transferase subunit B